MTWWLFRHHAGNCGALYVEAPSDKEARSTVERIWPGSAERCPVCGEVTWWLADWGTLADISRNDRGDVHVEIWRRTEGARGRIYPA